MYQRQFFNLTTSGAASAGDTGPSFMGELLQMRWVHQSGDTGGSVEITALPVHGDTGQGWVIYSGGLTPQFTKALRQPAHASDGFDTGVDEYVPVVAAGDRLRVKMTAPAAKHGHLYIWSKD